MTKIMVLMSTYNGEKYIEEQINSILNQTGVEVYLLIRDDGSSDNTVSLIKNKYKRKNIDIRAEENIGCEDSFRRLVEYASNSDYEYFAFADQDDYWMNNKLCSAIEKISTMDCNSPVMYCSNLEAVDTELKHMFYIMDVHGSVISKERALVQNNATGCSVVFNRLALELFLKYKPIHKTIHDYWMYLLCVYLGHVIYDKNSHILYRQHSNNVIGFDNRRGRIWQRRLRSFKKLNEHPREYRAQDLLNGFSDMLNENDIKTIRIVAEYRRNIFKKLRFFFNRKIRMDKVEKNFWLRIRILFGSV